MTVLACSLAADGWAWWYHVLSRPVMCFFFLLPHCVSLSSFVSLTLLLFTLPFMFPSLARSITHWCCFYDLFLWSLSLCLSPSANLLVCCREGIADWLWFILTPASVLWLAQSWHADTHTLTHTCTKQPFLSRVYSTGCYAAPDTREEPEQAPTILELQCCDVIRHGGYRLCLFRD